MQSLKQPPALNIVVLAALIVVPLHLARAQGQFPTSPSKPLADLPLSADDYSANWAATASANTDGANANGGGGGTTGSPMLTGDALMLEIDWMTNQTAELVIHPAWNAVANEEYDVGYTTNLTPPTAWQWLMRTAPGQTNLLISNLPPDLGFFRLGMPTAIRPGYEQQMLAPNDDDCYDADGSALTNLLASVGFAVNYFGRVETNIFVNNNGNVTFVRYLSSFTPDSLIAKATEDSIGIIAPFWADVDTRGAGSGLTSYGTNTVDGHPAFGVTWDHVGYFRAQYDKTDTFQLVFVDRSDRTNGDYDLEFNYGQLQWETGQASGGIDGIGGSPARAGFASIDGASFELQGSAISGSFLDFDPSTGLANPTGLIYSNFNSAVPGRYVFQFHDGAPLALPANSQNAPQVRPLPKTRIMLPLQTKN